MSYTPELVDELKLLLRFDLDSDRQGLKIHSTADTVLIAAARRLHGKGLITLADGGYLTPPGRAAAEHAQVLLGLLTAGMAASVA